MEEANNHRLGQNISQITNNSVMVVDQELQLSEANQMIMRVGHGSQMRNSSVGVKSNQNSSGKAVRKQTQNQNGPYMKVNDAKSNATGDTMYQVASN